MKKLLVLTLVLGMASVANATLMLSVDGDTSKDEIIMIEGDTAVIGVYSTDDFGMYDNFLTFGYVSEGGFAVGGARYPWWTGIPPIILQYPIDDFLLYDISYQPGFQPPGIYFEVDLTCTLAGIDVFVELLDPTTNILDTLIIHQVPEPMTIALLGLGGLLALHRRK